MKTFIIEVGRSVTRAKPHKQQKLVVYINCIPLKTNVRMKEEKKKTYRQPNLQVFNECQIQIWMYKFMRVWRKENSSIV